jgi:hypothetical protein
MRRHQLQSGSALSFEKPPNRPAFLINSKAGRPILAKLGIL